ncbi:hypothetical protein ACLKA7_010859 [Drosophila subpalustris]
MQSVAKPSSTISRVPPRRMVHALASPIVSEDVYEAEEEEELDLAAVTLSCWNCGGQGHRYQDCTGERRVFCYGCGKSDTYRPACNSCNASKNSTARALPTKARKQMVSKATNTD